MLGLSSSLSLSLSLVRMILILLPLVPLAGCATFSNVRSAQVNTGPSLSAQWMTTGDMGDGASYLWTGGDEAQPCQPCSHGVTTVDLSLRYGFRARGSSRAYELGVGVDFAQLYAEGFAGWNQDAAVTYGVGARHGHTNRCTYGRRRPV
jgi:hypothetical protein